MGTSAGSFYIACGYGDTLGSSDIVLFHVNENGTMVQDQAVCIGGGPSYLVSSSAGGKDRSVIYGAMEYASDIAEIVWDRKEKKIRRERKMHLDGKGPCYLAVGEHGDMLYCSCYGSGDFFGLDMQRQKVVWKRMISEELSGKTAGEVPHAHWICPMEDEALILVDLGKSDVRAFRLDYGIPGRELCRFEAGAGQGPRQFLPFQSHTRAVIINELGNSFSVWELNAGRKQWMPEKIYMRKTTEQKVKNWPGGACIWRDRILFVGNRGADTIAAFDLEKDGRMIGEWELGGSWPRYILAKEQGQLFVALQKSGEIVSMKWDGSRLSECGRLALPGAACMLELS